MLFQDPHCPLDFSGLEVVRLLGEAMADHELCGPKGTEEAYLGPLEFEEVLAAPLGLVSELLEVFSIGYSPLFSKPLEKGHYLLLIRTAQVQIELASGIAPR
jgi:hypothetical protein